MDANTAISIHVPAWGTTFLLESGLGSSSFQSTFPRGERLYVARQCSCLVYFNPRSRVGNDQSACCSVSGQRISIHVPAWGTTVSGLNNSTGNWISIHVPAWGTTMYKFAIYSEIVMISIHVPAWGTTKRITRDNSYGLISIHVPAWGTTANFHKYSLFFYAINIIFLLFIIPSLFSLVLFMLLF